MVTMVVVVVVVALVIAVVVVVVMAVVVVIVATAVVVIARVLRRLAGAAGLVAALSHPQFDELAGRHGRQVLLVGEGVELEELLEQQLPLGFLGRSFTKRGVTGCRLTQG